MNEQIKKTAIEYFSKYFEQNYSGTVVFSDPRWHAPKVFRAALWALKQAEKDNKADAADEIERLQRQVATLSSELAKWVTEAQRSKDSAQETCARPDECESAGHCNRGESG